MLVEVCREFTRLILALRRPSKKLLVLDLDNTLWGGVVGEVGLAGDLRRVPGLERRLQEAARLGFRRAIGPPSSATPESGA